MTGGVFMALVKNSLFGQHYRRKLLLALTLVICLAACSSQRLEAPASVVTSQPMSTQADIIQTPTSIPQFIEIRDGGFSLAVQPDLEFNNDTSSISISDKSGGLIISLNGRSYVESSYTLQTFLEKYLDEMASRGGTLHQSNPYEVVIDGKSGIAVDFTGSFLDQPITGKAVAVSPGEDFIVFGLGMSLQNANPEGWAESDSLIFETILASIEFKEEVR
jgi:hypothetical protein